MGVSLFLYYKQRMAQYIYLSDEGMENLKKELQELKVAGRKKIAAQIQEAREKGDLSENAEYDAAKDAQGMLEMKIAKLEESLTNARLVDKNKLDASKANILSTVVIKNMGVNKEFTYKLVAEDEADIKQGLISVSSPIGKGLLGKKKGDIAQIETPAGKIKLEILKISMD